MNLYDFVVTTSGGEQRTLHDFKNKVLVIVNTASRCGFTPQYQGLQKLYERYREDGLVILGFPCNQFAGQEPGSNAEIQAFCELNYRIDFPIFAKIEVNGKNAHPLFRYLTENAPGWLGTKRIKWNFTKFLIDRQGNVVKRFAPNTEPKIMEEHIIKLLN